MVKKTKNQSSKAQPATEQRTVETAPRTRVAFCKGAAAIYAVGFLLLAVFCCWTYGDVFHHIAQENFVCADAEAMTFVRRQSYGGIFWAARYVLLVFNNQWLGGVLMAVVLTLAAWLFDRLFLPLFSGRRCADAWRAKRSPMVLGLGFVPVLALLSWMVWRGYDLYIRCEVSSFVIATIVLLLAAAIAGLAGALLFRRRQTEGASESGPARFALPLSAILAVLLYGGLTWQAFGPSNYVRVTCKMQNILDETQDWQAMTALARSCERPTRGIAAYHAIALLQQNQVLEHAFDIDYDYPKLDLDDVGGSDEGCIYVADANLYAGLPLSAYHSTMENLVMYGPRVRAYKRMAVCSILNNEPKLAKRYLCLINQMPFQQAWVKRYLDYVEKPETIKEDPMYAMLYSLFPRENRFEQNYRQPIFLGYNIGLLSGSDNTLRTSVATCMYSKDLNNLLVRTNILQQKMTLPISVQQSIIIASLNRPGLLDQYPQVKSNVMLQTEFKRFLSEIQPYMSRKSNLTDEDELKAVQKEMGAAIRKNWLGSYYYYYYCGNLEQTVKKTEGHGVN